MNKNLSIVGIGRLGLCLALVLEKKGYNVLGCDINKDYVSLLNNKTFKSSEQKVEKYLIESRKFKATISLKKTVAHSVVNGLIDLGVQDHIKHFVVACNVNPGYTDSIAEKLKKYNWTVSFNPETVRQGTIIRDYFNPDCVYIGSDNKEIMKILEEIHENLGSWGTKIYLMDRVSAELTKVSLNCFLTTKISFANMVGDLALKIGANPDEVLNAVGADKRIGRQYFKYGFGYGGPCLPRDNRAFMRCAEDNNSAHDICMASDSINNKHLFFQIENFIKNNNVKDPVRVEHVSFKKYTDSIEESQQLKFAVAIAEYGYEVTILESDVVIGKLKEIYGDLFKYERRVGIS